MLTVAFTTIGQGQWTGGDTYLRNMLGMIARELGDRIAPKLFISERHRERLTSKLVGIDGAEIIIDNAFDRAGHGRQLPSILMTGTAGAAESAFRRHGVDVVFEAGAFYGTRFGLPTLSWIPDFQHRHLPHMFSRSARLRRDVGYWLLCNSNRTIMLSSANAKDDCERFFPASRGKTSIVRFAIDFDPAAQIGRGGEMAATYSLPDRYFYLPNQFWAHKNHRLVIEALKNLQLRGLLSQVLPVVLTGKPEDSRRPDYFGTLIADVEASGIASHFRYLGLVPYDHVFGLAGSCEAIVNPSLFEGWSTTVEEAKGLGAPLLLSDIPIHREQAPDSRFFSPADAVGLADMLLEVSRGPALQRAPVDLLLERQAARMRDYAVAFMAAVEMAQRRGSPARPAR